MMQQSAPCMCRASALFLAPVGRNDAFSIVLRPMETVRNAHFPARLSRELGWGGVGLITFLALAHMVDATQHHVSCTCTHGWFYATHGWCYATSCFLHLRTWLMLRNLMFLALLHAWLGLRSIMFLALAHMVDATQHMVGATQHHVSCTCVEPMHWERKAQPHLMLINLLLGGC